MTSRASLGDARPAVCVLKHVGANTTGFSPRIITLAGKFYTAEVDREICESLGRLDGRHNGDAKEARGAERDARKTLQEPFPLLGNR